MMIVMRNDYSIVTQKPHFFANYAIDAMQNTLKGYFYAIG